MGVEVEGDIAKVWETVSVTMNMGDYNNVKVDFGHLRTCANNSADISKTVKQVNRLNSVVINKRMEELKELYEEVNG